MVADQVVKPRASQDEINKHFIDTFPEEKRKAIVRKIDWRLPPFLALLYSELRNFVSSIKEATADPDQCCPIWTGRILRMPKSR